MKILHISGAKVWGGNEQQIIYCIPELEKLGCENVVFGMGESKLETECFSKGISFIQVKGGKLNSFKNVAYFASLMKIVKPDIIHLHTSNSLTFFIIVNLIYKLKVKCVFSKKAVSASSSFLSKYKYNSSGIDSIFCVSESVRIDFSKILSHENKKKAIVIHDCVSMSILDTISSIGLREQYSISKKRKIIGNIANHTDAKDLITLINVADYLVNHLKITNIVFFQIGEFSKLTTNLKRMVQEKELDNYVIFTNKIVNAFALNSQFDLFLMTSQREGGPTSVLEAMLIGTPIVSTNVGVIPDIIISGLNGYSSEVKDFKDLAIKINNVLFDENLKKLYINRCKDIIFERFTASLIATETFREYRKILSV
ncbi:glycosyltransferase family 4 protein [Flavobacterium sp. 14A]|uniref:glycosyltransferase family 4 protein n=1 Tax=Flavobacterium sp. 14A TaxID=2735896 RepID=UPI00156EB9F0|nr:glycosyltransferase family 4 protein [Flavobacterium sp. 14A]NRT11911.1 glycosyltransferase involved in cell wall biosynthesis [Flavobacterium sp. 14A]